MRVRQAIRISGQKSPLVQNIFYSKYSVVFRKVLVKKYINDNKSKLRVHRKVTCNCLLPTDWVTFMRCSKNKAELFPYIKCSCKGNTRQSGSAWSWDIVYDLMQYGGSWWKDLCSCKTCFIRTRLHNDQDIWQRRSIINFHQLMPLNKFWIHTYSPNSWKFKIR